MMDFQYSWQNPHLIPCPAQEYNLIESQADLSPNKDQPKADNRVNSGVRSCSPALPDHQSLVSAGSLKHICLSTYPARYKLTQHGRGVLVIRQASLLSLQLLCEGRDPIHPRLPWKPKLEGFVSDNKHICDGAIESEQHWV